MNTTIRSSLKQSLTALGFIIGIAGVIAVLVFASVEKIFEAFREEELLAYGWHDVQILSAIKSDSFLMTLPIWASLPYTANFCDELKSGFVKLYLHRTTYSRYLLSKVVACAVSGGLVLVLGIAITYAVFAFVFMPMESANAVQDNTYFKELFKLIPNVFFSGALWSLTGMLFSTATGSKYIAYASPFITYYLLVILHDRYLKNLYIISPQQWLTGTSWPLGRLGPIILIAELMAVISVLFWIVGERRLKRL